jgi:dihydroorotase (multifunctional complex type)
MPNVVPPVWDIATLEARAVEHAANAFVDFGLWAMAVGSENLEEFAPMIEHGAIGIKLFWGHALDRRSKVVVHHPEHYSAEEVIAPPDTEAVFEMFRRIAACDGLMTAHCEEPGLIAAATRSVGPVRTYDDFLKARPDAAEAAAISLAAEYARVTSCRFHVVHLTSAAGAEIVRSSRARGIHITSETCPQYLTLTAEDFARIGPAMKVNPPIRTKVDQDALWKALHDGTVASIGSDHAPHTEAEKGPDLQSANSGMVAIQSMVQLMLNEAVSNRRVTLEQLAWLLSESTARLYKVFPQKGAVVPGSDADFTVVDPSASWLISNDTLHSKTHLSPWHGQEGVGLPVYTVVRGIVVMDHGALIDKPVGRFVRPIRSEAASERSPDVALIP